MGYLGKSVIIMEEYVWNSNRSAVNVNGVWFARVYAYMGLRGENVKALLSTKDFSNDSEQPGLFKTRMMHSECSVMKTDYRTQTNPLIARYRELSRYAYTSDNPSTRVLVD
jgi:hypothetical protein